MTTDLPSHPSQIGMVYSPYRSTAARIFYPGLSIPFQETNQAHIGLLVGSGAGEKGWTVVVSTSKAAGTREK